MIFLSEQIDPFLTEKEKEILRKENQRSAELKSIISMLEDDLSKQRSLLKEELEKWNEIYYKAKLLMHANCNHKWEQKEFNNYESYSRYGKCITYDWCNNGYEHSHEVCSICSLVRGQPITI